MPDRVKVDRGIYKVGPCSCHKLKVQHHVYEVVVSAGKDRLSGKYKQVWRRHHGNLTSAREARRQLLGEDHSDQTTGGTLDELFNLWLRHLDRQGRAPKTIHGYEADADTYWRPTLGKAKVSKINQHDINDVLGKLIDRGLSPSTLDHIHACISGAFSHGKRLGWITTDYTKHPYIPLPSIHNRRPVVPTPEDVLVLLQAAAVSDRPEMERVIWLAAITGARNSEIRGLRLTDFDLEAGRMGIERAISAEKVWTTKNRKIRDVALDELTVTVIERQLRYIADRAASDGAVLVEDAYLFSDDICGRKHWREDFVTKWFSRLADDAGKTPDWPEHEPGPLAHLTFKHLRKFMDTYGQELGFTDAQVASRAGHDPSVARKHYTGSIAATDRRLSTALAELLTVAPKVIDVS